MARGRDEGRKGNMGGLALKFGWEREGAVQCSNLAAHRGLKRWLF